MLSTPWQITLAVIQENGGIQQRATAQLVITPVQREVLRDISTISVRSQYAVCTPFVRHLYAVCTPFVRCLYAVCTLICVHQYDLSTISVRSLYAGLRTSVRYVLNLYDVGLKLAQFCTHIPM